MSDNWNTSVTELLIIFRGAMLAIIPWLEKAKINWKEGEAYDDWDNIAESLYKNIVCSSLTGENISEYKIAKYNFNYDDYTPVSFIEVENKTTDTEKNVFVGFQSIFSPLDSIKVAEVDEKYKVIKYANLEFNGLKFVFIKNTNGKREIIDNITVAL